MRTRGGEEGHMKFKSVSVLLHGGVIAALVYRQITSAFNTKRII